MKREALSPEDYAADLLIQVKKNKLTTYQALIKMAEFQKKTTAELAVKFAKARPEFVTSDDFKDLEKYLKLS